MINDKRGQGLSTSAIVLIVLGIIVLAILAIGFTFGWKALVPWIKTNNIDTIKQSCQLACTTQSQYDYCSVKRSVNDGKNIKFDATCNELATDAKFSSRNYGIAACDSVTCSTKSNP